MRIPRLVRAMNAINKKGESQILLPFASRLRGEMVHIAQFTELGSRSLIFLLKKSRESRQCLRHQES